MSRKNTKYEEELRYVINQIGAEKVARLLPPEALAANIDQIGAEKVARLLPPEALIQVLLDQLGPETLEARLQAHRAQVQG